MGIFLVTSILAGFLAIHNAASRYLYALAAEDLLPGPLAAIHADHHAPHVASVTMTVFEGVMVLGLGALGASPYVGIASGMIGLGTIGIILMQIACALAVVGYFTRVGRGGFWRTRVLPLIGAAGLTVFLIAIFASCDQLTGTAMRWSTICRGCFCRWVWWHWSMRCGCENIGPPPMPRSPARRFGIRRRGVLRLSPVRADIASSGRVLPG